MKRAERRAAGFTIVETMIVLAVTGALFVAIAATLSGRQNEAQFTHALQSIQSEIQQVIDQTAAGFYPNADNFTCVKAGSNVQITAGANTQGTNSDCVFLGKVIQFQIHNTSPEQDRVYTVAGLRCDQTNLSTCLGTSGSPFVNVDPTVVGVGGNYDNYSNVITLQYGLKTAWMRSDNNSGCTAAGCSIGAVGFLMEPGSLDTTSTNGYASGTQPLDLIPLPGTTLNQTENAGVNAINNRLRNPNLTTTAPISPSMGVQICFVSGGTNESGLITIGGTGRQLTVKLDRRSNKTCT